MKAAQINSYGDANSIKINEVDVPVISEDQVLVEVHASSLNPFDSIVREGHVKEMIPLNLPVTLAGDIAGVVTQIGKNVKTFAVGDKVYGQASVVSGNSGALAEFAATSQQQIAKMPSNIDFLQAASMPLVGVSALQALKEHIDLKSGQKIFIHGGNGAIGSVAIMIAKSIGAHIATTSTGAGLENTKSIGADEVLDYKLQDFSELLSDFDAVFDTVGGDDFTKSFRILKPGSVAVSMVSPGDEEKAKDAKIEAIYQMTHVTTAALDELAKLIESGVVTIRIGKQFTFNQVVEAFQARESAKYSGKIVISIN